jgi:hypothetical protein
LSADWSREAEPVLDTQINHAAGKRSVSVLPMKGGSADECSCSGAEIAFRHQGLYRE